MEGIVIKELGVYADERGWLSEVFREDETDFRPAMSYLSMTRPGIIRGPHEHMDQADYFCFFGHFILHLWDNRKDSPSFGKKMTIDMQGRPYLAIVPPGVVHAYRNAGQQEALAINLPDRLFKGRGRSLPVDEVRYEDDPGSPFRIEE